MVFQIPRYWGVTVDGIQIVLCLIILIFLILNRKQNRKIAQDKVIGKSGQSFNMHVFTQTLNQQVDQAFVNIAEAIAVEQRKLDKVLVISDSDNRGYDISQYQTGLHRPVHPDIFPMDGDASGRDPLHEQIRKLAFKGMSARQISEDLKTPLGEVELVMSLRTGVGG
jgi:hypothetical protein